MRCLLSCLLLVGLAACDDAEGPSTPVGPAPAAEYCERTAAAYCDFYLRCGRMAVSTRDECLALFSETCEARYEPRYVALEQLGMLSLQRQGVAACAAHLATVQCEQQQTDLDGACGQMWLGAGASGSACSLDVESFVCAPGSACVLDFTLCGTCAVASQAGGSCEGELTCASGAWCAGGLCVERLAVGAPCTPNDRCVLGASCLGGVCEGRSYVPLDGACGVGSRCVYGATCVGTKCVKTALLGQPCSPSTPCENGVCRDELCVPLLPPGASCVDSGECAARGCLQGFCGAWLSECL